VITGDQAARRAELVRMKRVATGLLVAVTLLFVLATLLTRYWEGMRFVRAFAEAAMVGAIADWFAVTALFRHPLGLKIPHTAIIPTRKDRIAETFGRFVQNNFLSEEIVAEKIRSLHLTRRLAEWISLPEHSAGVAEAAAVGLRAVVEVARDEDFQNLIEQAIVARVEELEVAPLLGKGLALATAGERRSELLAGSLQLASHIIAQNKDAIRTRISRETPWWTFGTIDDRIYQKLVGGIEASLKEVQADPNHALHGRFGALLDRFSADLQSDAAVIARGEALKAEFLHDPLVHEFAASLWNDIKRALSDADSGPAARLRVPIERGIARAGAAVLANESLTAKIDAWLEQGARTLIREYGHEVGQLITTTIQRWDGETTSQRIELQVGKDLQYIRINGTLVGGLVGLVIYCVGLLLG